MNTEREDVERENAEFQASLKEALRPENRRRRNYTLPTLAEIDLAKIYWRERRPDGNRLSSRLLALQMACYRVLNEEPVLAFIPKQPRPWVLEVVRRLDREMFRKLIHDDPNGESETEQERLARLTGPELIEEVNSGKRPMDCKGVAWIVARMQANCCKNHYDFANVRRLGAVFGIEFESLVEKEMTLPIPIAKVYDFLRLNWDRVEECKTKADILRLKGFPCPDYDKQTLYRLFRAVGLPIASK
jgi:hypothetical protein